MKRVLAGQDEVPFSVRRLLGAAMFGGLIAGYAQNACDYTIPVINAVSASDQYSSSAWFPFVTSALGATTGAVVATLLARRWAMLAGILANSPMALYFLTVGVLAVLRRETGVQSIVSDPLHSFLLLATVLFASVAGALLGRHCYSSTRDRDLNQANVTIFGVRWFHYFWIFPLVVYPYLASLMMVVSAGALSFVASLYVAIHPSLWLSVGSSANASLNPLAVYCAFWVLLQGVERFLTVMSPRPTGVSKIAKVWKVVVYGLLAPSLAFFIGCISAVFSHEMPTATPGDWALGLRFLGGLAILWCAAKACFWIRNRMRTGSLTA